jgi:hypothetical protein
MSAPIGPGDWVECCPPAGYRGGISRAEIKCAGSYPRPGGVYQVREVGSFRSPDGMTDGLRLVGIVASYPGHPDAWWTASCFRPIYRPSESLLRDLLQPIPAELESAQ